MNLGIYMSAHAAPTASRNTLRIGLATAITAGGFGIVTAIAPAASAAPGMGEAFSCDSSGIYAVTASSIYSYPTAGVGGGATATGTLSSTALSGSPSLNAIGIAPGGTTAFAVDRNTKHVEQYDPVAKTWTDRGATPGSISAIKGAVDPLNGDYYFSDGTNTFYTYDPTTSSMSSSPITITGVSTTGNGDAAFNKQGDLYLVADTSLSFVSATALAGGGSIAATVVSSSLPVTGGPNGIAFTSDGKLYLSDGGSLYQINSATGALVGSATPVSPSGLTDLATCQYPPTLQLQASINSREAAGDQFSLSITGGGLSAGNTATTSGSTTGVQPAFAGPVPAIALTEYTFTETASGTTNFASYHVSAKCVDSANGNAAVTTTQVTTTSFKVTLPAAVTANGQAVVCTFINTSLPAITSSAFGGGDVGAAYAKTAVAAAGSTPYVWSTSGGSLPPGLTLNSGTGVLSGTPTATGTYAFTLVVTDANSATDTQAESITIATAPSITSPAFPDGEKSIAYNHGATGSGGVGPYTWSTTGGSLPAGLSLNPTTGVLSGTPTATGAYAFTLVLTDANGGTDTQAQSIDITAPAITSSTLPGGELGIAYNHGATGSGGVGPYTWSTTGGSLPAGLSLNPTTGVLSGTPTATGAYVFTLVLTDANAQTDTQAQSIAIASTPSISSAALPDGEKGVAYGKTATAAGGVGPYTWSTTGGTLPAGLVLDSSTGAVSGTPTTPGTYAFTLKVTDAYGGTDTQAQSIVITAPVITSPALPGGVVGAAYSQTPTGSGGVGPFTWSTSGGSLPPGLNLDPSTGVITGTPTAAGTYTFTLALTDANGQTGTQAESITVSLRPVVVTPPAITSPPAQGGANGTPYTDKLAATGGTGPYSWALQSGDLPPGLTLNPATGVISGVPTTPGSYTFTLLVTDANGQTATQVESIVIAGATASPKPVTQPDPRPVAKPSGRPLPFTGANAIGMAGLALVLCGLGTVLLLASRRRRTPTA